MNRPLIFLIASIARMKAAVKAKDLSRTRISSFSAEIARKSLLEKPFPVTLAL